MSAFLFWLAMLYLFIAAVVYAGAYLYGNSQGETPTQKELLRVALPWPYTLYNIFRAQPHD